MVYVPVVGLDDAAVTTDPPPDVRAETAAAPVLVVTATTAVLVAAPAAPAPPASMTDSGSAVYTNVPPSWKQRLLTMLPAQHCVKPESASTYDWYPTGQAAPTAVGWVKAVVPSLL